MSPTPNQVKETLETLKEIFNLTIDIIKLIAKNRIISLFFIGLPLCYFIGKSIINHYYIKKPKELVSNFYRFINEERFEDAWSMTHKDLRYAEWNESFEDFKIGFTSNGKYSNIQISTKEDIKNPIIALKNTERNYIVSLEKVEILKKNNLKNQSNWHKFRHTLWIQLINNKPFNQIIKETTNTIEYTKYIELNCKVMRLNDEWQLLELKKMKEGIKY